MHNNRIQILSTKSLDPALLVGAAQREIHITCLPFIETRPVTSPEIERTINSLADQPVTVIFTSSKSVTTVADMLKGEAPWTIYCLFGATKNEVQKHFPRTTVHATATDSSSLAEEMLLAGISEAWFFCGDKRMDTIPEKLEGRVQLHQLIVYTTHELTHEVRQQYDGILFFSPSAVKSYFTLNRVSSATTCFAVGNTTANYLKRFTQNITVAGSASAQAMVEKVGEKFSK